jgi:hypothetical protein
MSYFVGAFKANHKACIGLENILAEIVPKHLSTDPLHISDSPYLAIYGHRKVIQHLTIHNHDLRSWLVIIGTPLVRFDSEDHRQSFLADFLKQPTDSLRDTIDGNFAVFAYDGPQDRLIAATDLNNTTPIFYAATPDGVLFSSHELALARLLTPEIDPFGFGQTIHLGVTWDSRTRFRHISKLLPGQIVAVDRNKHIHLERYWRPSDESSWSGTLDENIDKWRTLLRESVSKFYECSNRQPVICDFTAGEDSRLILAQCRALGIPFTAHVKGSTDDIDVVVAVRASKKAGFDLIRRQRHHIAQDQLIADAQNICLGNDAYLEYFSACSDYATNLAEPLDDYGVVKYCGVPGGEAFRGSYYLRGKAIFPSLKRPLDYKFFTRMKYLLDYHSGLLRSPDGEFLDAIHQLVADTLRDVTDYPIGTQIDHMLRVFQTCFVGLMYKDPLYLPLATNQMTRSIYRLPPRFKRGGRLTKACTEMLFPELAFVNTQSGIPTVRRTMRRQPMFVPEYVALAKTIANGATSRLFKWRQANAWQYSNSFTADVFTTLLNKPPYCNWFSSSQAMITGQLYSQNVVDALLSRARMGSCRHVPTLGRIIGQELALRWVYREG